MEVVDAFLDVPFQGLFVTPPFHAVEALASFQAAANDQWHRLLENLRVAAKLPEALLQSCGVFLAKQLKSRPGIDSILAPW